MPLAARAFTGRISTRHITLDQRTTQDVGHWWKLFGQTLPALAQGQFGAADSVRYLPSLKCTFTPKSTACCICESPEVRISPTSLIQKEINLLCEVPEQFWRIACKNS